MFKELTEYSNNKKKTQAEMKVTLSERKIHRESPVERRKPGFTSTIWNIRKK